MGHSEKYIYIWWHVDMSSNVRPVNTRHWSTIVLTLAHRRKRRHSIKSTLVQRLVCAL